MQEKRHGPGRNLERMVVKRWFMENQKTASYVVGGAQEEGEIVWLLLLKREVCDARVSEINDD